MRAQGKVWELVEECFGASPGGCRDYSGWCQGFSAEVGNIFRVDSTREDKTSFTSGESRLPHYFSAEEGLMPGCLDVVTYHVRQRKSILY